MKKILINIKELSELTGISIGTLYNWVSQNKICHVKCGRLTKFYLEDIKEWIKKNTIEVKKVWYK